MSAYKLQPPDDDGRSNWRILLSSPLDGSRNWSTSDAGYTSAVRSAVLALSTRSRPSRGRNHGRKAVAHRFVSAGRSEASDIALQRAEHYSRGPCSWTLSGAMKN